MIGAIVCFSCISTYLVHGHFYLYFCEIIPVCTVLGGKPQGKRMHVTYEGTGWMIIFKLEMEMDWERTVKRKHCVVVGNRM